MRTQTNRPAQSNTAPVAVSSRAISRSRTYGTSGQVARAGMPIAKQTDHRSSRCAHVSLSTRRCPRRTILCLAPSLRRSCKFMVPIRQLRNNGMARRSPTGAATTHGASGPRFSPRRDSECKACATRCGANAAMHRQAAFSQRRPCGQRRYTCTPTAARPRGAQRSRATPLRGGYRPSAGVPSAAARWSVRGAGCYRHCAGAVQQHTQLPDVEPAACIGTRQPRGGGQACAKRSRSSPDPVNTTGTSCAFNKRASSTQCCSGHSRP